MTTFLLLHGACHDGWCWTRISEALRALGHESVAPDLPVEDTNAGLDEYAAVALGALDRAASEVVVVGHSLGALTAAVVASRLPSARRLVFVAGIVGMPGKALSELADVDVDRDLPMGEDAIEADDRGRFRFTEAGARELLYHDCPDDLAAEATGHLRFQRSLWTEVAPFDAWPSCETASVVCGDDRVVNPEWSRRIARERLGIEPTEIPGGHSPMLARPAALTAALTAGL